jgi:hypothetical protein
MALGMKHAQKLPLGQGADHQEQGDKAEAAALKEHQQQQGQGDDGGEPATAMHDNIVFSFWFLVFGFQHGLRPVAHPEFL